MTLQQKYQIGNMFPQSTKEYKVVWEKWNDPYGDDNEDDNDSDEGNIPSFLKGDLALSEELEDMKEALSKKPMKVIMTPVGIVPLTEYTSPSKIFNFWVGHTNFSITNDVRKIIEKTDGVETLDIFTRYRLKIGIGKVFSASDVMSNITKKLQNHMRTKENARPKKT